MIKTRTKALLVLAGAALALTACGGPSNTTVTDPDGSEQQSSSLKVSVVQLNTTEKVVCVTAYAQAVSCDWDNKISSP